MKGINLSLNKTRIIMAGLLVTAILSLSLSSIQGSSFAHETANGKTNSNLQTSSTACPAPFFNLFDHLAKAYSATTTAEARVHIIHIALCLGMSTKIFSSTPTPPKGAQAGTSVTTCPAPFYNLLAHLIVAYNSPTLAAMKTHLGHVISCLGLTKQQFQSLTSQQQPN